MVLISAGLIGAASDRTRTEDAGMEGDIEWVWSLIIHYQSMLISGWETLALTSTRHLVRHTLKTLALLPVCSHMGQT